jgi:hypothetical protein
MKCISPFSNHFIQFGRMSNGNTFKKWPLRHRDVLHLIFGVLACFAVRWEGQPQTYRASKISIFKSQMPFTHSFAAD